MIVICHGMVKSGSSFATQMVLGMVKHQCISAGGNVLDLRDYIIGTNGLYIDICDDIDSHLENILSKNIDPKDCLVIKWHGTCTQYIARLLSDGRAKAISTYRNPVEIGLSLLDMAKKEAASEVDRFPRYMSLNDTLVDINYQIECFMSWASVDSVEKIFFDDLVSNPHSIGQRVANRLEIEYNDKIVNDLLSDTNSIWEFNKGVLNRARNELDNTELNSYGEYWSKFLNYINSKR